MTNKSKCRDCQINAIDFSTQGRDSTYCEPCFEYAGWENTHNDDMHEDPSTRPCEDTHECPVCNPKLDMRPKKSVKRPAQIGNKNASGKQMSHAACDHEKTKAARERCRQQMRKQSQPAKIEIPADPEPVVEYVIDFDECPVCNAKLDEPCKTASGGRVKSNKGRHPQRDSK